MSTSQERHEKVQALFLRTARLAEEDRAAYLDAACGDDPGLRKEVKDLLALDSGTVEEISLSVGGEDGSAGDSMHELLERVSEHTPPKSRYKLEGEIARGGMGTILRVWDEDLRRHLAMKVVLGKGEATAKANTLAVDPRSLGRFLEEAQVTGQLDHPGIVPVHELGIDSEGRVYFTMKLVKGKTLKEVFDELARGEGGWTQSRVLGLILRVCEAMSYAHAKGVIHRDLKPANIMVGRFGEVYVMDWGLARILGREDEKDVRIQPQAQPTTSEVRSERHDHAGETPDSPLYTMDGDVVGTPAYMSPEQARGDLTAMGPHSDVYSVGAMLYHLLAGHMPYVPTGLRVNNYAVWRSVQESPPKPLHEVAPDAPAELVAICERAMARTLDDRYPDTSALAEDLSAYVEGRVVRAYETGAWAEARKWIRRNKPLAGALAVALLALVGGGVAFAIKADEATQYATEAQRRLDAVLRLSAPQDLEDLLGRVDALWPAHPERVDDLRTWVEEATALASELPRHRAKRQELRALALPQSEEDRRLERETHPESGRLIALRGELDARRRALLQRRDGIAAELPVIDWEERPQDALALNDLAFPLVGPDRFTFGRELEGLVLVQRALEIAGDDPTEREVILDTLAWALFAVGRDQEALEASAAALEAAPGEKQVEYRGYLARLEAAAEWAASQEGLQAASSEVERLQDAAADLTALLDRRQEWRFPEEQAEARWWNAQLTKLIERLEHLESALLASDAVTAEYGWSVPKRLAFARELDAGFAQGGEHDRAWSEAIPAIRAAYSGLELKPQMGLLPLRPSPATGFWEFWHMASGERPQVDSDRGERYLMKPETGIVLVLLPAGDYVMGDDSGDAGYAPGRPVRLPAFFIGKYEITQGQWRRVMGRNDAQYAAGLTLPQMVRVQSWAMPFTEAHPVEFVDWYAAETFCSRLGLVLPDQSQWEYACRAGSQSKWCWGDELTSLSGRENIRDAEAALLFAGQTGLALWNDGYPAHAPVGTFVSNDFGLFDMHGNVSEWCADRQEPGPDTWLAVGHERRYYRGGSWHTPGDPWTMSAYRYDQDAKYAFPYLGLRAARHIDP